MQNLPHCYCDLICQSLRSVSDRSRAPDILITHSQRTCTRYTPVTRVSHSVYEYLDQLCRVYQRLQVHSSNPKPTRENCWPAWNRVGAGLFIRVIRSCVMRTTCNSLPAEIRFSTSSLIVTYVPVTWTRAHGSEMFQIDGVAP